MTTKTNAAMTSTDARASDLIEVLNNRLKWARRDLDRAAEAVRGDAKASLWAEPSEVIRRIQSSGTDLARSHARTEIFAEAVAILDGSDRKSKGQAFAERLAFLGRLSLAAIRQLATNIPHEWGTYNRLARSVDMVSHQAAAEAWTEIGEAVEGFLKDDYLDDMTD